MEERDLLVRQTTYRLFVALNRAPIAGEVASAARLDEADIVEAWRRLDRAHALVLEKDRPAIRMANPFSAIPTAYRVAAAGRDWFANCAWDAFGICAALHVDGHIESTCPDCKAEISIDVVDKRPVQTDLLFHCLEPAAHWWDDIVFT